MITFCSIALLSEWSKPGQFQLAFPFLSYPVQVAEQVPAAFRKTVDVAARRAEEKSEAIARYHGPVNIDAVVNRCSEPIPETYTGYSVVQLQQFLAAKPVEKQWTPQQVSAVLGPALCMSSAFTAIYVADGSGFIEITYQTQQNKTYVTGYQHVDAQTEGL